MPVANILAFYGTATITSVKSFIGSSYVCRCKTSRLNPFGRILNLFIVKLHFFAVFTDDFLLTWDITYPSKRYLNGSYHDITYLNKLNILQIFYHMLTFLWVLFVHLFTSQKRRSIFKKVCF
jgi:hypothetical protein